MRIIFYTFSKKPNSTARPSGAGTEFDCQIKAPSSIISPIIQLSKASNPTNFNYAYIPDWNRYYFISDITYGIGLWILSLRVDVLASFKDDILATSQYILRNANSYNTNIMDTLYPTKASATGNTAIAYAPNSVTNVDSAGVIENYFNVDFTDGYFVIGVLGDNNSGITYYQLTYNGFKQLMGSLLNYIPSDFQDVSDGIAKAMLDPLQYITTCYWTPTPFQVTYLPTPMTINIASYSIQISGSQNATIIFDRKAHLRTTITIPKHPQSNEYGYLQLEPYSRYNLLFEPFGNIPLDTLKLYGGTTLRLDWIVDISTMDSELFVYNNETNALIYNGVANIGVSVRLSQLVNDIIGGATSLGGGLIGAVAGVALGDYVGAITSGLSGISSAVNSMLPQLSTRGSEGSFLAYSLGAPQLHAFYNLQVDTDPERYGRPLCEIETLNTLSGYTLCSNASLSLSCSDNELTEIESLLNGGFYIE